MKKIIIANNKGGVGKTTIASQIVYALADRGHSVIGVDLDSQRNGIANLSSTDRKRPVRLQSRGHFESIALPQIEGIVSGVAV